MQQKYVLKDRCILLFALLIFSIGTYSIFANTNRNDLLIVAAFQNQVKGIVTDTNGVPIPGVTVKIKGTSTGTFTNDEGVFLISASPTDVVQLTYIGFKPLEVSVGSSDELPIVLKEDVTNLAAVTVNAGYYSVKERERTGSIAKVTSEEIELQPITSPLEALQGRIAGVEVVQQSGVPGSAPVIRIRGRNSLRDEGNYPLYIIDGMPINSTPFNGGSNLYHGGVDPLSTLNLSNIESIEVLKDADATAIYGSRGANGVVLITTKKGNWNKKMSIEVRVTSGMSKVSKMESLLNTAEYLTIRKRALQNDNREPNQSTDYDLLRWNPNRYTNWQDVLFGGTAPITNVNIFSSGCNKTTSFRLGGSYYKVGSVFPGNNNYTKSTFEVNLNHLTEDGKFNIQFTGNYGSDQSNLPAYDNTSFIGAGLILPPNAPKLYNPDGTLNWDGWEDSAWNNPLAAVLNRTSKDVGRSIVANLALSYEILHGLSIKANAGYTENFRNFKGLFSVDQYPPEIRESKNHSSRQRSTRRSSWIIEPQAIYNKKIKNTSIDALVGITFQENNAENLIITGEGFVSENLLQDLTAAESITINTNQETKYKYNAVFGRLGYNWQRKYYLNLTGRRDGSSRFGSDKRFANFWAIGSAWIFSDEPFIKKNLPFVSFGKLRTSYGTTGSDQIGDYQYLDSYSPTVGSNGLYPTQLTNPNYSWEINKKLEASVQLGFINDRVRLGLSWYRNRSSNQLVGVPLPSTTGFGRVQANFPATVQNKGWEVELSTLNFHSRNFSWKTVINLTIPKNELLSFPNIEQTAYTNIYRVGYPLDIHLLYQYTGIDPLTGLYSVADINNDGRYSYEDMIEIKNAGRKYYGGIANKLKYKDFNISFLVEFINQDGRERRTSLPGYKAQQTTYFYNQWNNGNNHEIQMISESSDANRAYSRAYNSKLFFKNASYLRLKTLTLSYQLPHKPLQDIGLTGCSIYLQGQNLFTITNYKSLNVDNPGGTTIPVLRSITLGLNVKI